MTSNGALDSRTIQRGTRTIRRDAYIRVELWRGETRVTTFAARHAQISSAAAGRAFQNVVTQVAQTCEVFTAPRHLQVQPEDELWSGGRRWRVLAVDALPGGGQQLLTQNLQ